MSGCNGDKHKATRSARSLAVPRPAADARASARIRPGRRDVAELLHPATDPICRCGGSPRRRRVRHAWSPSTARERRLRGISGWWFFERLHHRVETL